MKAEVRYSSVNGTVYAPSSKSAMQRYIAGALLSNGITTINSATLCDDTLAAISIAETLGAKIKISDKKIEISGGFLPSGDSIYCGESGLSARMFTPIAALHNKSITINGKGSVLKRPFDMVEEPLRTLGVSVSSKNGFLPVTVCGPMHGGELVADGSVSSQFITGLLMALPVTKNDSRLIVKDLVSRPYIDLTISILEKFGIFVQNDNYSVFSIAGNQCFSPASFEAEGDWSGAAFLLVSGAIAGEARVKGLDPVSSQADRAVLSALSLAGANVSVGSDFISVSADSLNSFDFDISDCPDLAPPLTVLALACNGVTVLRGADRLVVKESNRGTTLQEAMNLIGGDVKFTGSSLEIKGGSSLSGGTVSSYNDHRIAMALACAGLISNGPVTIEGMECINKSYPGFADDILSLGGNITLIK